MAKLILVPTPIGNLEDITLRALRILKEVDLILAEDTRKAAILLKHYGIHGKKVSSYHNFNEHYIVENIVKKISYGLNIALISEAGTPAISDPGFLIVRECLRANIDIECLPGPTALIPALVLSGLPCETFVFQGFLPVKKGLNSLLTLLSKESRTMIFYEAPHRIQKTLTKFCEYFGEDRKASISREISKIYEQTYRGKLIELLSIFNTQKPKGEIVIVVEGYRDNK
ncbi:MAG TPA: 16S rRNA (cytidine(1402)-2'-O)-methyltransferase [Bacteroidales bacterium]|nr:16S rRNA (cytidine(1402)-2'-O)-methyltransferase [Bacteroidales bacterium]